LLRSYSPAKYFKSVKVKTLEQAALDKQTSTLGSMIRDKGQDFGEGILGAWILFLNESLNLKRQMSDQQIEMASVMILEEYGSLRFADLTVLFKSIIKGEYGSFYESLSIDKLMGFFKDYFDKRCEVSASSNESKHFEFRQDISDVAGTDRQSFTISDQQKKTQHAISHINIEKAKNKNK
tara:strand:- start:1113 stop:1652 length:540 start_codon:yes stop_codon:yes gene_type:complete